jgi:tellurite resistance protein TerC
VAIKHIYLTDRNKESSMSELTLFPFADYAWFYMAFIVFVLLILLLDLGVFHKKAHEVSVKESSIWTAVWISLALLFNIGLYFFARHSFQVDPRLAAIAGFDANIAARQVAMEFLTGFIIEKSLAIDNIFVFVVVFSYFAIPKIYQHRILFFGILGALIFRSLFIALGASLLQFHWVVIAAGIFLIATGIKILFAPEKPLDPGANPVVRLATRHLRMTPKIEGQKFFVRKNRLLHATPLFLALIFIEFSDIIFAVDSVPAIFALTREPLIVFTSNIFAILGLRSLYFLLAGVIEQFRFLKYGLGFILIFVGLKMSWLNELFGGKFPIGLSLGIIGGILALTIIASLLFPAKKQDSSLPSSSSV